jgi:RimJ/RimL family protein N-acetyltransferase
MRLGGIKMTQLKTDRLVIRNFHTTDWGALYEMIVQYQSSELAAYDQPWPTTPEEIRKITEWFANGDSYLAVCLKATGRFIGFVALNPEPSDDQGMFNLGYVFNFDYHGHGYATEACRAVLGHAFDSRQAQRVVTGTAEVNRASCRLLERLGFQKASESTGSFRQTSDGKPIPFVGYTFELSRDAWEGMAQYGSG